MKKIYIKLLFITTLIFGLNTNSTAQNWMVGDAINDTIKYLQWTSLAVDSAVSCSDLGQDDFHFAFQPNTDPGI